MLTKLFTWYDNDSASTEFCVYQVIIISYMENYFVDTINNRIVLYISVYERYMYTVKQSVFSIIFVHKLKENIIIIKRFRWKVTSLKQKALEKSNF